MVWAAGGVRGLGVLPNLGLCGGQGVQGERFLPGQLDGPPGQLDGLGAVAGIGVGTGGQHPGG